MIPLAEEKLTTIKEKMKVYIFLMFTFIPFSMVCMENNQQPVKNIDFKDIYDQFQQPAMQCLTEKEKQAIRSDTNRDERDHALRTFAWHTVNLTYKKKFSKELSDKKLEKKSKPYAAHLMQHILIEE